MTPKTMCAPPMHSTPRIICVERELNRALELAMIQTCTLAMQEFLDLNQHKHLLLLNKSLPRALPLLPLPALQNHLPVPPSLLPLLLNRFPPLLLPMNAEEDALPTKDAAMDNASIPTTINVLWIPSMESHNCVPKESLEAAMEDATIHLFIDARMENWPMELHLQFLPHPLQAVLPLHKSHLLPLHKNHLQNKNPLFIRQLLHLYLRLQLLLLPHLL